MTTEPLSRSARELLMWHLKRPGRRPRVRDTTYEELFLAKLVTCEDGMVYKLTEAGRLLALQKAKRCTPRKRSA